VLPTITMTIDIATTSHYQLLPHHLLPLLTAELHLIYQSLQHSYKQLCLTYSDGCGILVNLERVTQQNNVSIFYRFRDIASYLSKIAYFDPPHLHLAPSQGVTPVEFRGDLWHQKTKFSELSCGVCVILRLALLVEQRLVTDRRTDRHRLVPRMHSIAR